MILMLIYGLISLDEQPGDNFGQAYWHILSDPAHLMVEVTLTILIDVILLGVIWPLVRNFVREQLQRQHAELDAELGVVHHDDHVHHEDHVHHGDHVHSSDDDLDH